MGREWERRDFLKSITLGTTALSIPQSVLGSQQSPQDERKPNISGGSLTPAADIYHGKVYGIFDPLKVSETVTAITITGSTFAYAIDRASGQITSVKALGDEFVAPGTSFPNPYVGLMPEDDPGARREGRQGPAALRLRKVRGDPPAVVVGGIDGRGPFRCREGHGASALNCCAWAQSS